MEEGGKDERASKIHWATQQIQINKISKQVHMKFLCQDDGKLYWNFFLAAALLMEKGSDRSGADWAWQTALPYPAVPALQPTACLARDNKLEQQQLNNSRRVRWWRWVLPAFSLCRSLSLPPFLCHFLSPPWRFPRQLLMPFPILQPQP